MNVCVRRQRGFFLLELAVALLIATLLAVFAADRLAERGRETMVENHVAWMGSLRQGVQRYIESHAPVLVEQGRAAQVAGFNEALAPSLPELKAAGFLAVSFPMQGVRGLGARVQLVPGEDCASGSCRLEALIYSDAPLGRDASRPYRPSMVAHWLAVSAGRGGAVMPDRLHAIGGAAFEFNNPPAGGMAPLPPGTVATAITAEQLQSLAYLKVGDHRDPRFQGAASIEGDLSTNATLYVQEHLRIGSQASAQAPCATDGAIVQEALGGLLICRNGQWRSAGGRGGGGYSINSMTGCAAVAANPVTGTCSCPNGYLPVRIVDSTSAVPSEGRTRGYMCVGI